MLISISLHAVGVLGAGVRYQEVRFFVRVLLRKTQRMRVRVGCGLIFLWGAGAGWDVVKKTMGANAVDKKNTWCGFGCRRPKVLSVNVGCAQYIGR